MHILVTSTVETGYSATVVQGAPTFEMLQGYVGGYIDAVNCWGDVDTRRVDMYVHDEGLLLGLRPTLVVEYGNARDGSTAQPLVGSIVVTATDHEGETVAMTGGEVERWLAHYVGGGAVDCNLQNFDYDDRVWKKIPMIQFAYRVTGGGDEDDGYDDGHLRVHGSVFAVATAPTLDDLLTKGGQVA